MPLAKLGEGDTRSLSNSAKFPLIKSGVIRLHILSPEGEEWF
jgi:hypothetical protein